MKRNLSHWFALLIGIFFFSTIANASDKYILDSSHSHVLWHINHFGFSNPTGQWFAEGNLDLNNSKPENSKVNVIIKIATVVTGIPALNKHLKSKLFFDVEKYPTATFKSTHIKVTGKDMAQVVGDLNLHGVTKPVTLSVKLNKIGLNAISDKMTAGFSATAQLKRSDFGMNALVPGLSDEVKLDIEVEAVKKDK